MLSESGRSVLLSKVAVAAAMVRIRLLKAGQREDDRYSLEQREQRDEAVRREMAVAVINKTENFTLIQMLPSGTRHKKTHCTVHMQSLHIH